MEGFGDQPLRRKLYIYNVNHVEIVLEWQLKMNKRKYMHFRPV